MSLLTLLAPAPILAKNPQPANRIPLETLGFQPISSRYLLAGSSMLTVHYVDDTHLLVTFAARRLIRRIPGDPPTDQDHNTDALLLELPSGRILARTEWLFHDHGQYLWNLGHGQFLLRNRDTFTTLSPLVNLARGHAFDQRAFINSSRHIVAVILSHDNSLLTIESTDPLPVVDPTPTSISTAPPPFVEDPPPPSKVQLNFYRILPPASPDGQVIATSAGGVISRNIVELPVNSSGMLNVLDQGHQRWAFDFHDHTGKLTELSLYDSTCRPLPVFVSASEFVSFGCHGGTARQQIAGFNLRGEEMWEQTLYGSYVAPHLEYAPAAGRFALSRVLMNAAAIPTDFLVPSMLNGQTIDVYQNDSGKPLLHLDCNPIVRANQNFAFSPDGMELAIVREGAIEIYRLPPLGAADKKALKLAEASAPPPNNAMIDLSFLSRSRDSDKAAVQQVSQDTVENAGQAITPPSDPTPPTSPADSPVTATETSDEPQKPRKPPTLYNPPAPSADEPPH
ncbi:hypothetical protein [Granulicella sp. dw_53]|uniref:hypothetical protein n=1 Tax=Granulicella sp. dw_53 TaxID=2719792 RepID=UPI001BD62633|nr:hypothetical protein [Granulicella sp. dw_53]